MCQSGKIANFLQVAGVKRYAVTDGAMRGLHVLEADNGKLRFLLNEDRAFDIMQVFFRGENISFVSKNGFTMRNAAFERRFEGGMLYTCGLDALGNVVGHETHGSLHLLSATVIRSECDGSGILLEAEVRDSALFGKNLRLRRTVQTEIGSGTLTVEDELFNDGDADEEYCLLYHVNLGYPFLDEGARIEWDADEVVPRNESAQHKIAECTEVAAPISGEEENCYYVRLNRPMVSVLNGAHNKKFTLSYSGDTLPHFIEWKSMRNGDYALGLEPCTSLLDNQFTYSRIARGQAIKFRLQMTVEDYSGDSL